MLGRNQPCNGVEGKGGQHVQRPKAGRTWHVLWARPREEGQAGFGWVKSWDFSNAKSATGWKGERQ